MNHLLLVIGDQGSGKSSVVDYLVKEHGFIAVRNESLYIRYQREVGGYVSTDKSVVGRVYRDAEAEIRSLLKSSDVVHEATGAKPEWRSFYGRLTDMDPVTVMVECPFNAAMSRRSVQDMSGKAAEPEDHARYLHDMLVKSGIEPDFRINNSGTLEETHKQVDRILEEMMK